MRSNVVKVFGLLAIVLVAFFIYSYFFGPMYGGKKYQEKAIDAEAKILLRQYYNAQTSYFKANKKYDIGLHQENRFQTSKNFSLGFNDIEQVKKYCSECKITDSFYKIAAYGTLGGEDVIWTIDNFGELTSANEEGYYK